MAGCKASRLGEGSSLIRAAHGSARTARKMKPQTQPTQLSRLVPIYHSQRYIRLSNNHPSSKWNDLILIVSLRIILMTNFHQPRTTLLVMIEAFVGSRWRRLYEEAIDERYRMLSFGDAMLLDRHR